ncbi:hypothetical protein WDM22_26385 [Bradyrhizobium septentrionale]|uniref:hypothetical protein n=1 Tax=Bradyrhizobium septentrionale TaxID=1404411 RepID=UPI0030D1F165
MSRVETADDYSGFVAQLNADWRVVACRDRIQWILQRRGSPKMSRRDDWRGRSYCRTSQALILSAREYAGPVDSTAAAILAALPARIELDSSTARKSRPNDVLANMEDHH